MQFVVEVETPAVGVAELVGSTALVVDTVVERTAVVADSTVAPLVVVAATIAIGTGHSTDRSIRIGHRHQIVRKDQNPVDRIVRRHRRQTVHLNRIDRLNRTIRHRRRFRRHYKGR